MEKTQAIAFGWLAFALVILGIFALFLFGFPHYRVWSREKAGQAELAEAEWSKRIAVEEAKARAESAVLDAQAEIERAKGVAEANAIIGESLQGNDEYLRYLWITHVEGGENRQVIYVPTEASLPILEAERFNQ
jgi:regulator of protease activity HflC (stomatin/prohibitin superfamily)